MKKYIKLYEETREEYYRKWGRTIRREIGMSFIQRTEWSTKSILKIEMTGNLRHQRQGATLIYWQEILISLGFSQLFKTTVTMT